ncbi:hypothetical protein F5Y16DRAFT_384364 [Xylariaceae sp. FL0255]|nr:hypothetical protein F5Y16DRAFT_384364 [Xylariaceae sp. FL0255]
MGIATGSVEPGDVMCVVKGISKILLLRPLKADSSELQLKIVGTGLTTDDLLGNPPINSKSMFHEGRRVKMDAMTLFELLS